MNPGVGPGTVWVVRDRFGGFRMTVLLVDEVTRLVNGRPSYVGEPVYSGVVLMDSAAPEYEGKVISYRRSHLFDVFERLL